MLHILVHMDEYNYSIMHLHIVLLCSSCNSLLMHGHSSSVSKYYKLGKRLRIRTDCFSYCLIDFILIGSLDQPIRRLYVERDWRFGHYEMEGLQDPLSRFSRYILQPFHHQRKAKSQAASGDLVL